MSAIDNHPVTHPSLTPDQVSHLEENLAEKVDLFTRTAERLFRWQKALIVGAVCITAWVVSLEYREHENSEARQTVKSLWEWKIKLEPFDAPKIIDQLKDSITSQTLRIQRTEDQLSYIKATVDRIESSLARQHPQASNADRATPGGVVGR